MSEWLIGFLATIGVIGLLVIVSLITGAVTDIRIARATGVDPRVDREAAKRAEQERKT